MALRPIAFSIPSTTELKVTFSKALSEKISKDNFEVESLSGAVSDLEVTGVTLTGKVALIKTKPQVSGNYYLLRFVDTSDVVFASEKGTRLLDDSISRDLFFVGIDNINPIRDRMLREVPQLFDVDNTNLRSIISAQAEEMYRAQIAIGRNLSNNYISIDVEDEFRTRGPGATDRMANENAYEVVRVSDTPTSSLSKYATLDYTSDNTYEALQTIPFFPVSLQQELIEDEEISASSEGNSFDGFLLSLAKPNVIRVLSVTYIRNGEVEDCDGNLGTEYDLDIYKYAVLDNTFDQKNAFSFSRLENNQILLSEFGNISRPTSLDSVIVTYLHKDLGKYVIEDTVEVSKVLSVTNESVPSNAVSFFLDNAPVVTSDNEVYSSKGGVTFRVSENSTDTPDEFKTELLWGVSRMPSSLGEYTVNYETGEVFVVGGENIGDGTGRNNYVMDYGYRKTYLEDVDYSVSEQKVVGHPDRGLINEEAEISFNYDKAFAEGTDYKVSSHIEVINEQVQNKLTGSFSLRTESAPITDVFRILNQTTGEVYNLLYHTDTEVYFSGNRSPQIVDIGSEVAKLSRVVNEELEVIGKFVVPSFEFTITSNASNNSITFEPGIPAELISFNSDDYFVRVTDENDDGEVTVEDLQVRFFGDPDANNLINSFAISSTATPPSNNATAILGPYAYQIYLDQEGVMNKNLDAIGNLLNKSITFSDSSIFSVEKYFAPLATTNGVDATADGGLSRAFTAAKTTDFYDNMSRLRKVGDYAIDYANGIVYVAIDYEQDIFIGKASYYHNGVVARNSNVFNATGATKKLNSPDPVEDARVIYDNLVSDTEVITILDLENSLSLWDGETEAGDLDGEFQTTLEVLEDYTVVVPHNISNILSLTELTNLTGTGLESSIRSNREAESTASELLATAIDGGDNIYDPYTVSFEKNVIDLKTTKQRRVYANADGDFAVTIYDSNAESFYSAKLVKTDLELFDDKLNITKISGVKVLAATADGDEATVYISSSSIDDIDVDADFLLDSDGSRFVITAVDTTLSTITVESPAANNVTADTPNLDSSGADTSIVVKPTVTVSDTGISVVIPSDAPINSGDLIEFVYLSDLIPDVGTPLAIDYRYGHLYVDYTYIKDRLAISYEYGDNSLDWSISDALSEGQSYYVTYKYGAGREALRANFGSLTNIPFFDRFPLSVDRELYRKAIQGTLQTFPKGPTLPAFEELVKSFTDINPNIDELAFGNWILGRDYLHVGKPDFEGDLEFRDGKFNDGLLFQPGTTVNIPAISSLSLEEGTVEGWVRPNWSGIDNDADITVQLNNIGDEKLFTDPKDKLFDKGWDIHDSTAIGGTDDIGLGFRLFNYRADDSVETGISIGHFLLKNEIDHLTEAVDFTQKIRIKAPYAAIRYGANETTYTLGTTYQVGTFGIVDGTKFIGGELSLSKMFSSNFVSTYSVTSTDLPDYERPHFLRSCACSINNTIATLEKFNSELIEVDFGTPVDFSTDLSRYTVVDNSPDAMVLIDDTGTHWQVKAFEDNNGKQYTASIPPSVRKVLIARFPVNDRFLSGQGVDEINASLPSGAFNLYLKTFRVAVDSIADSNRAFGTKEISVVDWSEYIDIKLEKEIAENLISVKVKNIEYDVFYHELIDFNHAQFSKLDPLGQGGIVGCVQDDVYAEVQVFRNRITLHNRFSLSDIYIGQDGYNPKSNPFTINREDSPLYAIGLPKNIDTGEGVFIGFDELCTSPLSDEVGQWVFRARAVRGVDIPESVTFSGSAYTINFTTYESDHKFTGLITTDGAFSSVVKAHRDSGDCLTGIDCNSHFRYCGKELLEDIGWVNIEEVNSDLINTILGGRETFYEPWIKVGEFTTSVSDGIYRITSGTEDDCKVEEGNYLYSRIPCDGNVEIAASIRVASIPSDIVDYGFGSFSGAVSGIITGITPIALVNSDANIKVTLGMTTNDEPLVIIYDGVADAIVDYVSFNWNDNRYHEYKILTNTTTGFVQLYIDDLLLSQVSRVDFEAGESKEFAAMEFHIVDRDIIDIEDFVDSGVQYIVDVDLIEYSGNDVDDGVQLEDTDIFIHTESQIEFEFNIDPLDGYDAYDGYDGYVEPVTGTDEIFFSADRPKYFLDAALTDHSGRISIYKDGKGFLNFRIYDESLELGGEVGLYNLSTNIKHWVAGELHHVAASWKLNSIDEKDEMHLFIDGVEAPNIYKFGGTVPLVVNAKFSDVSKEALHNFLTDDVEFCDTYENGTIVAGSTRFSSDQLTFTDSMIGRSILIVGSDIASNLIGGEYIIKSIVDGSAIFGTGSGLETVSFTVSASDIEFKFPPTAGITTPVLTDLRNSKFTIFHTNADGTVEELGGILYEVDSGDIDIISGSNIEKPKFRANIDTRVIEFVGEDSDCNTIATVALSDTDIHIETFGLNLQRCKQVMDLSASSYVTDDSPHSGKSILRVYGADPLSLSDVLITRMIMDRTVIEIGDTELRSDGTYLADFTIALDAETKKVSSDVSRVSKQNLGRVIKLWFDSDNIVFCDTDGYSDGYTVAGGNTITVYGATTDGDNEETFIISKNGYVEGEKFFTSVDRVEGTVIIADPDYFELGMVAIQEVDPITTSNNNGDYAEIYDYQNGTYTLSTKGSNGTFPFELHAGKYIVEYPSYLRLSVPHIGEKLYIGSDYHGEHSWDGVIDEFRIISEMSSDTRSYETYTAGTRSITRDFNTTDVFCADAQTLALIHFDNPIEQQNRRLRIKEYLDGDNNIKYKLSVSQREELLALIGDGDAFISKMINSGFDRDEAEKTYYETLYAEGGPIINEAEYYNNFSETQISGSSVNDIFGKSGYFKSGSGLLYDNDMGYFRHNEGTIEFWVSPVLDTKIDQERRYYVDIADVSRERVKSKSSSIIELSNAASEIISVKLLTSAARYESFYTATEASSILFDEIARSEISGRLEGGAGTDKDFGVGSKLSANGKIIYLGEALPGQNTDIIVTYVPLDSSGDRVSVFKNEYSQIVFGITADGVDHIVSSDVNWKKNTWHRVMCTYKTGTKSNDTMRIFVDGEEGGLIRYGTGLIYGTGFIYGQYAQKEGQARAKDYRIELGSDFRMISVGSDIYGDKTARSRMDNLRFSSIMRNTTRDSLGNVIDTNYSSNTDTIYPVIEDDATTFILNFDTDGEKVDKFATVIDPVNGIFDFDIEVIDNFNQVIGINDGEIEDLITDLVNRLKPAHANALVKFIKSKC